MKNKSTTFLDKYSNFNVSKYKKWTYTVPGLILFVAMLVIVCIGATTGSYANGVNIGIDFEGGTMLEVILGEEAIDNYDENMKLIKDKIEEFGVTVSYTQKQEATNVVDSSILFRYKNISKNDAEIYELNSKIINAIDKEIYPEIDNTDSATEFIKYQSIGASAAKDLLSKAAIAIVVSTLLILVYIMFRFTPLAAVAAIITLLHDAIIMLALTIICRVQINTSFVAAIITIISYSINNTIIIFDRCREYMKPLKGTKGIDYDGIGNMSVRENMRRSIFTTMTTMVTVIFLAALGSDTIREFCVPIILGLIAGLYSSVFLATPLWASLSKANDIRRAKKGADLYVGKVKDEEIDLTAPVKEKSRDDDDGFDSVVQKPVAPKQKQQGKPTYKYTKKNTTFKK